jgi:Na+-transporting NADH:ubiquinone oxidoreductase subunit NqrC
MKYTLWALLSLSFAAATLLGQTAVKSPPAQKSPASLMTDQEKNFRAYIELLRSDLKKNRTQVVGQVMQLDAEDAAKFWPIYTEFETEYKEFGNGVLALVLNYAANYDDMTPQVADQLATKLLDLEQERNDLKRKYYQRFKAALDPITAARFLQVENQIERILDLQIASQLPVIEAPQGSQP